MTDLKHIIIAGNNRGSGPYAWSLDEGAARSKQSLLTATLAESKEAYSRGDDVRGAQLLQRFEVELFG